MITLQKYIILLLSLCSFFLAGCWDRTELNEQAIWLATGWDIDEEGEIEISGQIIIPAKIQMKEGGSGEDTFFVVSSKGDNVGDILDDIQKKLPRKAFFGQRRVIIFSEDFAKHGLTRYFDNINRTPLHSLRGAMFVIEGATAKEALMQKNPLESQSAFSVLQQHRLVGGGSDRLYLYFLISSQLEGIHPTLPTIKITSPVEESNLKTDNSAMEKKILELSGVAVFNDNLEMQGSLTNKDNRNLLWIMGLLKKDNIVSEHKDGNASADLYKVSSKITPEITKDGEVKFSVLLKGTGLLQENNSNLDVRKPEDLKKIENEFAKETKKEVLKTIKKVQTEYGIDIFGFGETLHHKYPSKWKTLKNNWDEYFANTEITVTTEIKIKEIGLDGPSILIKGSEENH